MIGAQRKNKDLTKQLKIADRNERMELPSHLALSFI